MAIPDASGAPEDAPRWRCSLGCLSHLILERFRTFTARAGAGRDPRGSAVGIRDELTARAGSRDLARARVLARASFNYSVFKIVAKALLFAQWAKKDLNFRPHAYQACALTN